MYLGSNSIVRQCFMLAIAVWSLGGAIHSAPFAEMCDLAARHAAQNSIVPLELLLAITRVEAGRTRSGETEAWPWALNQAGKGYWFDDSSEAIKFADDLLAKGEDNYDVGCFQINMHWHGKNFDSTEAMFDPEINARYAAEFLTKLLTSEGGWPQAVAAYHSRSPEQAEGYLVKVEAALNELRGTDAASPADDNFAASVEPQVPRANSFPLLQTGSRGVGASLVPLTEGNLPLFAAAP